MPLNNLRSLKAAGYPLILASWFLGNIGCGGARGQVSTTGESQASPLSSAGARVNAAQPNAVKGNTSAAAATYRGCTIFRPGDAYNSDITTASIDPHSKDYIASITGTDDTGFYASTGIEQVNFASASTPLYEVKPQVPYHSFPVRYPVPADPYIEPYGDRHYIVLLVTPPRCRLYELYSATFDGAILSAYSGASWDLALPYRTLPNDTPSSMASGLSMFAGMVKHEEIATGVKHALNFSMYANAPCNCFTAPASSTDGQPYQGPSTKYEFPYGGRLRLKATFDDSSFGPESKAIAEAMKHYGILLADTGGHYINNNALYLGNPTDGGRWHIADLASLNSLRFVDFDVLAVGTVTAR